MSTRFARQLVRLYPRAWRARYEEEFVALLEARELGLRDVLDVGRGASREWLRSTWIGRALALAFDAWMTAMVSTLIIASIGSLVTGVGRFVMGLEPTLTLPFLSLALANSLLIQMPMAIALAGAMATPWFFMTRVTGHAARAPVVVRAISLVPVFAVCMTLGFRAEQLGGMMLAAWIVSEGIVSPKAKAVAP